MNINNIILPDTHREITKNFGYLLMIFKDTASGYKYQESRGGHDLDEITRAFAERMKKVVQ